MASDESSTPRKSGGGCLGKLASLVALAIVLSLGTAVYFIIQPQDLGDVGGCGPTEKAVPVRDLKVVLQNSLDRGYVVRLTETEINQWLGSTLVAKQGGLLGKHVKLNRVWVRLKEDVAEVIMVRDIMGKTFTTSMFLKIEQEQTSRGVQTRIHLHGGQYHPDVKAPTMGGQFGKLTVPQGFLILVLPAFEKLSALFQEEIELGINRMARVKIEKNRLVLDPNEPGGDGFQPF